jgi:hypothetical protein
VNLRAITEAANKWACWLFGHRYHVVQAFDRHDRKLWCCRCGRYFAMSDRWQMLFDWDADFEQAYCQMYDLPRTNK